MWNILTVTCVVVKKNKLTAVRSMDFNDKTFTLRIRQQKGRVIPIDHSIDINLVGRSVLHSVQGHLFDK